MNLKITLLSLLVLSLNQVCFSQIYSVGNDDGFSVSCYSQVWTIYRVGVSDGGGVSCVGGVGIEVPLPIELINFKAYVQNKLVNLEWQTASEINNDYFTIERSKNGVDWEEVTTVDGAGNSSTILSYSTIDKRPYFGVSYYRLKQTDYDGKYKYSDIKAVNFEQTTADVVIYPNPINNQITIQANEKELANIKIYNALGQDVTNRTQQLSKSSNSIIIDLRNLSNGIYTVKTLNTVNKIVKQ